MGHQDVQDLTNGVLIEYPFIQRGGGDAFGQIPVRIGEGRLILRLVLVGKIVVHNALVEEFQLAFHGDEVHQKPVPHGVRQLITIGRHAVLQIENTVGVLVNIVLRRGGQAHQRRVEIVKDVPIFVVNGAVRLVADDEVEVAAGEQLALIVLHLVDAVIHRLVSGKHAVGGSLLFAEIHHGQVGELVHKTALGLRDQAVAVGEEQDVADPAMLLQHL